MIDYHSLEKYEIREEVEGQLKVVINQASLRDMGEYTLNIKATSRNTNQMVSKNISLPLVIFKLPAQVSMRARPKEGSYDLGVKRDVTFYAYGESYDVTCQVEGYPVDTSSSRLHFQPCNSFYNCMDKKEIDQELTAGMRPVEPLLNPSLAFNFTSTYSVTATESGRYSCSVLSCSSWRDIWPVKKPGSCEEPKSAKLDFFVSDFDEGFDTKGESNFQDNLRPKVKKRNYEVQWITNCRVRHGH